MAADERPVVALLMSAELRERMVPVDARRRLADVARVVVVDDPGDVVSTIPVGEVGALVTGWDTPRLTADLLAAMPRLELVAHTGGSVRHLLPDGGGRVAVTTAAAVNAGPVVEFCYAQVVLALKGALGAGEPARPHPHGLYGADVGIVSFGMIGQGLASRLRDIDARVRVWDPVLDPGVLEAAGVERVDDLGDLFGSSAIVSVHTPLIPSVTEGTVRAAHLRRLGPHATLLNTARGAVIDERELVEVLRERPDVTAVLDVVVEEPVALDHPLRSLGNVHLTGHVAGSVGTELHRLGEHAVDRVLEWSTGAAITGVLSDEALALRA